MSNVWNSSRHLNFTVKIPDTGVQFMAYLWKLILVFEQCLENLTMLSIIGIIILLRLYVQNTDPEISGVKINLDFGSSGVHFIKLIHHFLHFKHQFWRLNAKIWAFKMLLFGILNACVWRLWNWPQYSDLLCTALV